MEITQLVNEKISDKTGNLYYCHEKMIKSAIEYAINSSDLLTKEIYIFNSNILNLDKINISDEEIKKISPSLFDTITYSTGTIKQIIKRNNSDYYDKLYKIDSLIKNIYIYTMPPYMKLLECINIKVLGDLTYTRECYFFDEDDVKVSFYFIKRIIDIINQIKGI